MKTMRNVTTSALLFSTCLIAIACNKKTLEQSPASLPPPKVEALDYQQASEILVNNANHSGDVNSIAIQKISAGALKEGLFAETLLKCAQNTLGQSSIRGACLLLLSQNPNLNQKVGLRLSFLAALKDALESSDSILHIAAMTAFLSRATLFTADGIVKPTATVKHSALSLAFLQSLGVSPPPPKDPSENPWESALRLHAQAASANCDQEVFWWRAAACWRDYSARVAINTITTSSTLDLDPSSLGFTHFRESLPTLASFISNVSTNPGE